MRPADRPAGSDQKRQVLAQVSAKAGALVTLNVQSVDADPVDDAKLRGIGADIERVK